MTLSSFSPRLCCVKPLAWDSAEFGFGVGELTARGSGERVTYPDITEDTCAALVAARADGLCLVYLKSPELTSCDLPRLVELAGLVGTYTDNRVSFEKRLIGPLPETTSDSTRLSPYPVGSPSPSLVTLGLQAGEHSRFRRDPRFPESAFVRLYTEWIRRSVLREVCSEVLVATTHSRNTSELLGFVSVATASRTASVELIAVSATARNLGVGTVLMRGAEAVARRSGCEAIRVTTQQSNAAACRLYRKAGYGVTQSSVVHHLWLT